MTVLDSSALLCFLLDEPGADVVEDALHARARCSAANWSEVAQKAASRGLRWSLTRQLLLGYGLEVEPVTRDDAEAAAALWVGSSHLSIADRLCLALATRLGETALTTDRAWGESQLVRQVRPT